MTQEHKPVSTEFRTREAHNDLNYEAGFRAGTRAANKVMDWKIAEAVAAERRRKDAEIDKDRLADLIEGMEVSVDVSTCDEDASNRLFGTVTVVQEYDSAKNGLILLVQEPEPNFDQHCEEQQRVKRADELKAVAEAALAWIDAVPAEVRESLPAMPGFDRDWADETIAGEEA